MPIIRDASGRATYVPFDGFYPDKPIHFFQENEQGYRERVAEARKRVLEVIRFNSRPLRGRGLNHEVYSLGSHIKDLVDFIDDNDGKRARRVSKQRRQEGKIGLVPGEFRLRSPQDVKRRRSALFRVADIPKGHFGHQKLSAQELTRFIELMRWYLIEVAVLEMYQENEIECVNGIWYAKVSVMDSHPPAQRDRCRKSQKKSRRVKRDDRSYHGLPQRDRQRSRIAA